MRTHLPALLAAALTLMTTGSALSAPVQQPQGTLLKQQPPGGPWKPTTQFPYAGAPHEIYGVIRTINGNTLTLQTRRGLLTVDAGWAAGMGLVSPLYVTRAVTVHGVFLRNTFVAHDVTRNNQTNPGYWPPDR